MSWSYQLRTQRLSADWNQGLILAHHHQLFDGYRMNTTSVNYCQDSGNTLGLQQQVTCVLSVTLLCCSCCQPQPLSPSDTRTTNQGNSQPCSQVDRASRTCKLKPEPGECGHVHRGKQKTKHMYWRCSKCQLQFKSSPSTNRLQGPIYKPAFYSSQLFNSKFKTLKLIITPKNWRNVIKEEDPALYILKVAWKKIKNEI